MRDIGVLCVDAALVISDTITTTQAREAFPHITRAYGRLVVMAERRAAGNCTRKLWGVAARADPSRRARSPEKERRVLSRRAAS
jgi:hypothetical protein